MGDFALGSVHVMVIHSSTIELWEEGSFFFLEWYDLSDLSTINADPKGLPYEGQQEICKASPPIGAKKGGLTQRVGDVFFCQARLGGGWFDCSLGESTGRIWMMTKKLPKSLEAQQKWRMFRAL